MTEEEKDKAFVEAYQKLVDEHRRSLQFVPAWRYSQDGNDFRLVVEVRVMRLDEGK